MSVLLYYSIIISILWSRVYYSAHTFSHVIIGHFQAGFLYLLFAVNEDSVNKYFKNILTQSSDSLKSVLVTCLIAILSVVVWVINEAAYPKPEFNERTPGRCN